MTPHWTRGSRALGALVAAALLGSPAVAQVGHAPDRSPFRDIRRGSTVAVSAGYFSGDAGALGVGASDGPTATARFELALGGATVVSMGASYAQLQRDVLDPAEDSTSRRSGPVDSNVLLVDAGLQLRLTGQKTWRRLSPYIGAAIGLAWELSGADDPGGYTFGTKFTIAPGAGVRIYPAQRLSVVADVRMLLWRLSYPTSYQNPGPDGSRILEPGASTTDWTTHPWASVGVAWTF